MNGSVSTASLPADSIVGDETGCSKSDRGAETVGSFDAVNGHFLHRGEGIEFDMEARWVCEHLPPHCRKVLDLGCGIGALFPAIGRERALGIDYLGEGLVHTRARFPGVPLMCAAAERLPLASSSLDAITLQHVVEHISATVSAAREWHRVLKAGGMLLVLTPNASFADPSVFNDPTHVRLFDRRDLAELLATAGFEIVDLGTIGLPWFRHYRRLPCGWRLRRSVVRRAGALSAFAPLRWKGQTLCCAARRPVS